MQLGKLVHRARIRMVTSIVNTCFRTLFLAAPRTAITPEKAAAFDDLLTQGVQSGPGPSMDYTPPYPKHEFLTYLVQRHGVLLHGSTQADIQQLRPRPQTDCRGRQVHAVFASGDSIWTLFSAILDRRKIRGSLRNGGFVIADGQHLEQRYYFFSVNAAALQDQPWVESNVYILLRSPFSQTDHRLVRFDEWMSSHPVYPLARLAVSPADFPFLTQVAGHNEAEPMFVSWLTYKRRLRSQLARVAAR